MTKQDNLMLQSLQNQVMRVLLSKRDWLTPTEQLLNDCNMLSVHQLVFNATAITGYKATTVKKPAWLAEQMRVNEHSRKGDGAQDKNSPEREESSSQSHQSYKPGSC